MRNIAIWLARIWLTLFFGLTVFGMAMAAILRVVRHLHGG